jgi:GNAT superfamily N-acetyltransferase
MRSAPVVVAWGGPVTDAEMVELVASHGGTPVPGWWDRIRPHSLGWVTARAGGTLVGFVNVAWDGGAHAFLLDAVVDPPDQGGGIGRALVRTAAQEAAQAGCEWLHVDFEEDLAEFYVGACGFRPTAAGVLRLRG